MRQWLVSGTGRFLLSCTVITAIGLAIGAGGPVLLAQLSHPAQAQNVLVQPEATPDTPAVVPDIPEPITLPAPKQSVLPPPAKLIAVPGFAEPLVATGAGTVADDAALQAALSAFRTPASKPNDFAAAAKPLEAYLAAHPGSPWTLALQTNLGFGYYADGYYSKALNAWQQAWDAGKGATGLEAKRLADRALGELARMHARLGHANELDQLFAGVGDRKVEGAATELMTGARAGLWAFRNDPGIAYLCGPKALVNVLKTLKSAPEQVKVADDARSGPNGVSLTELSALATKAGLSHQLIKRAAGQAIPVPSVVHWGVNHYAAVTAQVGDRYLVKDPTFSGGDQLLTAAALDAEGSGYFLVPAGAQRIVPPQAAGAAPAGDWRAVDAASAEAQAVYGKGYDTDENPLRTTEFDPVTGCPIKQGRKNKGMCGTNAHSMTINLNLSDTPVGYDPTKGAAVGVTLTYNHREATQPANFNSFNVGQKWNLNWLSYVSDIDDTYAGYQVTRYPGGGGAVLQNYTFYDATSGEFINEELSRGRVKRNPASGGPVTSYEQIMPDGSRKIYGKADGATMYRRFFLTQLIDAQGNTVTLTYNDLTGTYGTLDCSTLACVRLSSITDATGKVTSFSYELTSYPLLITKVTDPFGRFTTLTYDAQQRLASITDPVGITSSFVYDTTDPSFITTLKTPYGANSFAAGEGANYQRWLNLTDAMGFMERIEFNNGAPGIASTDAAAVVPSDPGLYLTNGYNQLRNSFYWGKHVVATAGTTDYTKAHIRHWVHDITDSCCAGPYVESEKRPLENRVWYNYPGQVGAAYYSGSLTLPRARARVLDDGTTQITTATYHVSEYDTGIVPTSNGNLTSATDALGRKTVFNYATNWVDLTSVQQQISATPTYATLASFTYDANHNLLSATDAAGQVWRYAYNAAGQMIYATNPLNQTRFWEYDASGRMTRATVPVAVAYASVVYGTTNVSAATAQSYNYTAACSGVTAPANNNLPISVTDSQGYVLCYQYDALDRVTKVKYPDGTTEQYSYAFPAGWTANGTSYAGTQSLDVWQVTDRQGRVTSYTYDRNRRLTAKTEPVTVAGVATTRTTSTSYYADGTLKELTDGNGNVTHWDIDIQSRPTAKTYAYGTANAKTESYTYDLAGRLKTVTDAKGQVLTLVRNKDDSIASYAYTNATIATPGASFTYDPWYPRRTGMTDQFGSTSWTYIPVGTNGALGQQTENGPFGNDSMTLAYDAAGRVNSRTVSGTTAETFGFDTLGRMNSHVTQLGTFTYGYLGNSGQVSTRTIGTITTTWGYDTNANDRRLLTISTTGAVARNFTYASNAYQITGISDTPAATHPWLGQTWSFSYDGSDRLLTGNGTIAGNSTFQYDKLDNATSFAGATASYNGLNQITAWNAATHTYDNNGNLTGDGVRTYTYDAADRLKTVTQGGTTTTFAYDGLGRRLKQTVGTTETRYLWCGAAICQQRSNTDVVQKRFVAEGEYVLTGTKKYLTLTDHLGSVRDLIDITGTPTLVGSFDYTPYGAVARSWGTVTPGYTYAGLFAHPQTGLLLSATRAYEPGKGRFLNRDMIPDWGYGYGNASPMLFVDPNGTNPLIFIGIVIGGASGAIGAANATGGWHVNNLGQIAVGALVGAGFGAIGAWPIGAGGFGLFSGLVTGTFSGFSGDVAGQLIGNGGNMNQVNWCQALFQAAMGAGAAAFGALPGLALDLGYGAAAAARWGAFSGWWGGSYTVGMLALLPGNLGGWGWGDFATIGKSPIQTPNAPKR